jgi:hypothetical protein
MVRHGAGARLRDAVLSATRSRTPLGLALAMVLGSCAQRIETEILVVVIPTGFGAETLGTLVIEARPFGSPPPCGSRSSASTTAAVTIDALHEERAEVHTLGVLTRGEEATWITIWGKIAGRDRARRSFLTRAIAGEQRVLCVAIEPGSADCQCADPAAAIAVVGGTAGVEQAVGACAALVAERGVAPQDGVSAPVACELFAPSSCPALSLIEGIGSSGGCAAAVDAGGSLDGGAPPTGDGGMR